jgi:D-lactate dehydrogenase
MRTTVFSTRDYDREFLSAANEAAGAPHTLDFVETHLSAQSARMAVGAEAVCAFVNDVLDREVLTRLASAGARLVALRCAGFNNVDLAAAQECGIAVARVPAYSPMRLRNIRWR